MAESTDKDEEIGPFSAFSVGDEGSGFARFARGGAGIGFGQTPTPDYGSSGLLMIGVSDGNADASERSCKCLIVVWMREAEVGDIQPEATVEDKVTIELLR
ncbi:hypothetical protein V2J09_004578 [Rumex salicifolius]